MVGLSAVKSGISRVLSARRSGFGGGTPGGGELLRIVRGLLLRQVPIVRTKSTSDAVGGPDHSPIGGCHGTSTSTSGISAFTIARVSSTSRRSSSAAALGSALATKSRRSARRSGLSANCSIWAAARLKWKVEKYLAHALAKFG